MALLVNDCDNLIKVTCTIIDEQINAFIGYDGAGQL